MILKQYRNADTYDVDCSGIIQGDDLKANFERLWPQVRDKMRPQAQSLFDFYIAADKEPFSGYAWALVVFCLKLGAPKKLIPRVEHANPVLADAMRRLDDDPAIRSRALKADYRYLSSEYLAELLGTKTDDQLRAIKPDLFEANDLAPVAFVLGESNFNPEMWTLISERMEYL